MEKLYLTSDVFLSMSCDYIIPMSQELLSDADIESLTTEFGERVDFNTVELDGIPGMFRKARNAANVTTEKVKRAFINKHNPNRNHGLDNAKDKRDNEYLYKHDKRNLKNEERVERQTVRNDRREMDYEREQKLRDIKNKRDIRNNDRITKRDNERSNFYSSVDVPTARAPAHNPYYSQYQYEESRDKIGKFQTKSNISNEHNIYLV